MFLILICVPVMLGFVVPAFVVAGYYFLFSVMIPPRRRAIEKPVTTHFGIVIPAHNEEAGLPRSLHCIASANYPQDKITTLVIADNCTDGTATVARRAEVACLEREHTTERGKGYALAAGIPLVCEHVDAVLVLDADCEFAADALLHLDAVLQAGARVAQAAVSPRNPEHSPSALTLAAGAAMENAVAAGRSRCELTVALRGTGMAFRSEVLSALPWAAFGVVEDREYADKLHKNSIFIEFVSDAKFFNDAAPNIDALLMQRRRWRAGLFSGGVLRLVESKPLVLAHLVCSVLAFMLVAWWLPLPWLAVGVCLILLTLLMTMTVYLKAMHRAQVRLDVWPALTVVVRLALNAITGLYTRSATWQRTPRLAETTLPRHS